MKETFHLAMLHVSRLLGKELSQVPAAARALLQLLPPKITLSLKLQLHQRPELPRSPPWGRYALRLTWTLQGANFKSGRRGSVPPWLMQAQQSFT